MSGAVPPDPLVRCPFNSSHVFTRSRLQHHIIKCSKNYPNHLMCPYNALHRFLTKEELTRHIMCCPESTVIISLGYLKEERQGDLRETPYHYDNVANFNKELEDWDAEYQQ